MVTIGQTIAMSQNADFAAHGVGETMFVAIAPTDETSTHTTYALPMVS